MSIESLLKELTEAVRENTEALLAGGGTGSSESSKSSGSSKSGSKASSSSKGKSKKITVDQIADKAGKFLGAGSAADKKKAVAAMKKVNAHFGVDRITEADEDQYEEIMAVFDKLIDGEDPFDDDDDGDEDESLV